MRDVLPTLVRWNDEGRRFATATVVCTWGSSPRPIGSVMGVREDGLVCGSVSGGCVESAVIEAALKALRSSADPPPTSSRSGRGVQHEPPSPIEGVEGTQPHPNRSTDSMGTPRIIEIDFGQLTNESVWEVGLSCGGRIQVWIDPNPVRSNPQVWCALTSGEPCVIATSLDPFESVVWNEVAGSAGILPAGLGVPADSLRSEMETSFQARQSRQVEVDGKRYFLHVLPRPDRLLIVGAVHIALPLIRFAKDLGFETIVVDPRATLTVDERFPTAPDQVVTAWPEQAFEQIPITDTTYAVVLTHDPKIDDAALAILLKSPAAYIGALGSRTTQTKRRKALAAEGFSEDELARIHGPVGLDIGACTPEEIALSIIAEIVQVRRSISRSAREG